MSRKDLYKKKVDDLLVNETEPFKGPFLSISLIGEEGKKKKKRFLSRGSV
jgi:hypothetical protein